MSNLKHAILAASDVKVEPVSEWGQSFHIKRLSGGERSAWQEAFAAYEKQNKLTDQSDVVNYYASLLVFAICEPDGARVFSMDDMGDMLGKSPESLKRVFDAAAELNGLKKKAVEDAEKN